LVVGALGVGAPKIGAALSGVEVHYTRPA